MNRITRASIPRASSSFGSDPSGWFETVRGIFLWYLNPPNGLINIPDVEDHPLKFGIPASGVRLSWRLVKESSWEGERPGPNQLGAKPTDPECARQAQNCWMRERSSGSSQRGPPSHNDISNR